MLSATPNKAAAIILGKSFDAIFSFGPRKEIIQKSTTEPPTRITINPNGATYFGITSLATVKVTP